MKIANLFQKPKVIAVLGDVDQAKSNLLYHIIEELKKAGRFNLYTYGLRNEIKDSIKIYSVEELEQIENSVIILDEIMSLWDLDNRMAKRQIEKTLRLIFHNNNVLVLCAVPENVKKFIAGKINMYFFKKVTISDFINGSKSKIIATNYKGSELGSSVLNLEKDVTLFFDGLHYHKIKVPYYRKYDTKRENKPIIKIVKKSVNKKINNHVNENISYLG